MGPRIIKLSFSEVNLESFSNKNHICCKTLTLSSFKYLHFVFTWTLQIIVYWINRFSDIENKLPVMFWIHGGSFLFGDNTFDQYGPNQFMKDQNVILITINYRVGPIGFLSMGTEIVPGNAGFRDQNMALTWWLHFKFWRWSGSGNNIWRVCWFIWCCHAPYFSIIKRFIS